MPICLPCPSLSHSSHDNKSNVSTTTHLQTYHALNQPAIRSALRLLSVYRSLVLQLHIPSLSPMDMCSLSFSVPCFLHSSARTFVPRYTLSARCYFVITDTRCDASTPHAASNILTGRVLLRLHKQRSEMQHVSESKFPVSENTAASIFTWLNERERLRSLCTFELHDTFIATKSFEINPH